MHVRTPPSRLFSLHTCRLCACACACVSAFTRVTSHESTSHTSRAITLGPERHGFDVIARMGTDTILPPTLRPWLWRPRVTRLLACMHAVSSARRGLGRTTNNAPRDSGVRSASPWRRVLSAFATGGKRTRPAVSHRVPRTLFVSCALQLAGCMHGAEATRRTPRRRRRRQCGQQWRAHRVTARARGGATPQQHSTVCLRPDGLLMSAPW
jgi:hypothetical protein